MHLEYWGLSKHPFSNVPDPDFFFANHASVQSCIKNILGSLTEDKDVFAAIIGPAGAGKTMSMRIILEKLDSAAFHIAFVTNPDMTFPQFLREIIGQIDGKACNENDSDKLIKVFKNSVSNIHELGKRPLIIIDEGNMIKPHNFESIYMLIKILQDKDTSFSIILIGQPAIEKRLIDHRNMNLRDSIHPYCQIRGLESREILRDYINFRLAKAGLKSEREIFGTEAIAALWSISDHGNPRIINKICSLCLKLAESGSLKQIDAKTVSTVGTTFMQANLSRFKSDSSAMPEIQPLIQHTQDQPIHGEADKGNNKPINSTSSVKHENISYEIKPDVSYAEQSENMKIRSRKQKSDKKTMSSKDLEELASRLATQRIKSRNDLNDTFEAWEQIRNDILIQLKNSKSATTN